MLVSPFHPIDQALNKSFEYMAKMVVPRPHNIAEFFARYIWNTRWYVKGTKALNLDLLWLTKFCGENMSGLRYNKNLSSSRVLFRTLVSGSLKAPF